MTTPESRSVREEIADSLAERAACPEELAGVLIGITPVERDLIVKALRANPSETAFNVPNGWKLVPLVPTDEMEKAAAHEDNAYSNNRFTFPSESRFFNLYAAMLRTAPEAPSE